MGNLLDILGNWTLHYYGWRYLIIGLWLVVQEETAMIFAVYALTNHYLGWPAFLLTLIVTYFVYEMFFYLSGRYVKNTRLGRYIERKIPHYAKFQFHLHKKATAFLILSRFVMYLNTGVLFLSGWSKISLKKIVIARTIANIFWLGGLILLSYFSLSTVNAVIAHQAEIAVVLFLVIILAAQHIIKKAIIEESEIEEEAVKIGKTLEKDAAITEAKENLTEHP